MLNVLILINFLINLTFTVFIKDTYPIRQNTFNRLIRIIKRAINLASVIRRLIMTCALKSRFSSRRAAIDYGNTRALLASDPKFWMK